MSRFFRGGLTRWTLVIAFCCAGPAQAQGDFWRVLDVLGNAHVVVGAGGQQAVRTMRQGDWLGPGEWLRTGANSHIKVHHARSVIVIHENSVMQLPGVEPASFLTRVVHRAGRAFFQVDKRKEQQFLVETPLLIVGVKGTEFLITVTPARDVVDVVEGVVEVRDRRLGSTVDVSAGERIEILADAPAAQLKPVKLSAEEVSRIERFRLIAALRVPQTLTGEGAGEGLLELEPPAALETIADEVDGVGADAGGGDADATGPVDGAEKIVNEAADAAVDAVDDAIGTVENVLDSLL